MIRTFQPSDVEGIRAVMEASLRADRIPGLLPGDVERSLIRVPGDPEGCLVAEAGGIVVGYCIPRHDDLTVHPDHRRRGHGRRLLEAARALVGERGLPYLMLHGPTHLPATRAFIEATGARYHSSLWMFELSPEVPVPSAEFPRDVTTRPFGPDVDFDAYVQLMNRTFLDHPTPLSWTPAGVRLVHDLPDFDPGGVLLVALASDPDHLVAFSRVEMSEGDDGQPEGWVGLIGVLPDWRGRGLGRALLRWGVEYLRACGAIKVTLSAEATNERATRIYRDAGFTPTIEWPHYVLDV